MTGVYEICLIALLFVLAMVAIILLITATVKYKIDLIWWIASIPLWFASGYVAYFEAKRKYLASEGAPQKEIDTARKQSVISLLFMFIAWLAIITSGVVGFIKSRPDPSAFEGKPAGIIFWSLLAVSVVYIFMIYIIGKKGKSKN